MGIECLFGHSGKFVYKASGSCHATQACTRCGTVEDKVIHNWGGWVADSSQPCKFTKTCQQCERTESKTQHDYDDEGVCRRCRDYSPLADDDLLLI